MANKKRDGQVRVLVSAASAVRRAGLEAIVRASTQMKLSGSAYGVETITQQAVELSADVILVDLERSDARLLAATERVMPPIPVVALVDQPDLTWSTRALSGNVKAILPRDATEEEISSAIHFAYSGLVVLDQETTESLVHRAGVGNVNDAVEELTPREIEVLRLLADGVGNKQLALQLGISEHTVKFHISSILDKLGASSRTEAVTTGLRAGLIVL
jgi:two-component system, NarL family, response regulator YdfI